LSVTSVVVMDDEVLGDTAGVSVFWSSDASGVLRICVVSSVPADSNTIGSPASCGRDRGSALSTVGDADLHKDEHCDSTSLSIGRPRRGLGDREWVLADDIGDIV